MGEVKKVAVIIPFYTAALSENDKIALRQCHKILSAHPIIAVKPQSLVLPADVKSYPFFDTVSFNNDYFTSKKSYNRLMLSAEFYNAFTNYEYILIHQLDAFVFKDELLHWCDKDIDYAGAPWIRIRENMNRFHILLSRLQYFIYTHINLKKIGIDNIDQLENRVGNGGFSLRRVKKLAELCHELQPQIAIYNQNDTYQFNEDVFWSVETNRGKKRLNIPGYEEALDFAFEIAPERAKNLNYGRLPFGCHAWDLNLDFWKPIFEESGYIIR
jgi:hypothetical protein